MKKLLLSIFTLLYLSFANAQCTDLFISEYVEGDGNNKALEIYNPTTSTISLNNKYRIVRYGNGDAQVVAEADNTSWINLGAISIASYSTFVFVLDKRDPNGLNQEVPISASLKSKTDALIAKNPIGAAYICPVYNTNNTLYHNGNDAIGLQKETAPGVWSFVDIFGRIGDCPIGFVAGVLESTNPCASSTAGWSDLAPYSSPPANYNEAEPPAGQGYYFKRVWTTDKTLKRRPSVKAGTTANPAAASWNPSVQWDSTFVGLSKNNFSNLGVHTCDCNPASIKNNLERSKNSLSIFPIPAINLLNIVADAAINSIEIGSLLGDSFTKINTTDLKGQTEYTVDINHLKDGVYFVNVLFKDNTVLNRKMIVKK